MQESVSRKPDLRIPYIEEPLGSSKNLFLSVKTNLRI